MNRFIISIWLLLFLIIGSISWSAQDKMQYAMQLYQAGRVDDAINEINSFIKGNPDNVSAYLNKGIMIRQKGIMKQSAKYFAEARDLFIKADSLTRDQNTKIIIKGNLGTTYLEMGQYDAAKRAYGEAFKLSNRFFYRARVAYCLAREAYYKEAFSIVDSASKDQLSSADSPGNEGLTFYNFGLIYSLGRRPNESIIWIEAALTVNKKRFTYSIHQDTDFNNIKSSSEFQDLLKRFPLPNERN